MLPAAESLFRCLVRSAARVARTGLAGRRHRAGHHDPAGQQPALEGTVALDVTMAQLRAALTLTTSTAVLSGAAVALVGRDQPQRDLTRRTDEVEQAHAHERSH